MTYIPNFNQGVIGNLFALKNQSLQKLIRVGATHVAPISPIEKSGYCERGATGWVLFRTGQSSKKARISRSLSG